MSVILRPDFPRAPRIPVAAGLTEGHIKKAREALANCHELYASAVSGIVNVVAANTASGRYQNRLLNRLDSLLTDLAALHDDLLGEVGEHLIERE